MPVSNDQKDNFDWLYYFNAWKNLKKYNIRVWNLHFYPTLKIQLDSKPANLYIYEIWLNSAKKTQWLYTIALYSIKCIWYTHPCPSPRKKKIYSNRLILIDHYFNFLTNAYKKWLCSNSWCERLIFIVYEWTGKKSLPRVFIDKLGGKSSKKNNTMNEWNITFYTRKNMRTIWAFLCCDSVVQVSALWEIFYALKMLVLWPSNHANSRKHDRMNRINNKK